jgi:chaperonin GroES
MSLNIKPIAGTENRVVVEAAAAEEKTASGIIIPDTAKEKPQKGTVISVSEEDAKGKKPTVAPGDTVLYGKYAGTEITYDGKEYLIMRETDIYAVLS